MTVERVTSNRWNGLSTDTKPTPTIAGSIFTETNTGFQYTWDGTAWILRNMTNPFFGKKTGTFFPRGNSATSTGMLAGLQSNITGIGSGVETTFVQNANGAGTTIDTVGTQNSIAGFRWLTCTSRQFNPVLMFRFQLVATADVRFFAGFSNTSGGNPASNSDYLNAVAGVGLWLDTAVSSNWKIMHNDSTGASTQDSSNASDALIHTLSITAIDATPSFVVALDGTTMTNGTITADLPSQTTALGPIIYIENTAAASKTCQIHKMWIEADL